MEIIYRYDDGKYPFHHPKQANMQMVEFVKLAESQQTVAHYREIFRTLRALECPHIMKLVKVLKEDHIFHCLYEYYEESLETYLSIQPPPNLSLLFQNLQCGINCLIKANIRADLHLWNIGVVEGVLKIFVCPEVQIRKNASQLIEFYTSQYARLKMEMKQIWERGVLRSRAQEEKGTLNSPNFIISGNGLIFLKVRPQQGNGVRQGIRFESDSMVRQGTNGYNLAQNIINQIDKHHANMEKSVKTATTRPNSKIDQEDHSSKLAKFKPPNSKDKHDPLQGNHPLRNPKSEDSSEIILIKRESHRTNGGYPNILQQVRRTNQAANESPPQKKDERQVTQTVEVKELKQGRQTRQLKQIREVCDRYIREGQQVRQVREMNVQQGEQIGKMQHEGGIHVTTELINKYKMKIITCQQIEFEGAEGQDLQRLAQQKLREYQLTHGLGNIVVDQSHSSNDRSYQKSGSHTNDAGDEENGEKAQRVQRGQNQQIMQKVLKAKEKASIALKEYARNRKK